MNKIITATLPDLARRGALGLIIAIQADGYNRLQTKDKEKKREQVQKDEQKALLEQLERGLKSLPIAPSIPVMIVRDRLKRLRQVWMQRPRRGKGDAQLLHARPSGSRQPHAGERGN